MEPGPEFVLLDLQQPTRVESDVLSVARLQSGPQAVSTRRAAMRASARIVAGSVSVAAR